MAGHSKWANIQHRKNRQDSRRGKIFTKLIREITVATRTGGGVLDANPRLRAAIDNALSNNMTRDTIDRAIKRSVGEGKGGHVEEIRYEGYGPGGVAVLVDCMTDNRNRTVAEVRRAFTKCGGNLSTEGSVTYLFNKVGLVSYAPGSNEDILLEIAINSGADDVMTAKDGSIEILSNPEQFHEVKDALLKAGHKPEAAEITMYTPTNCLVDANDAKSMINLLEMLEDMDDVQKVYSNADIPNEIFQQLS